MLFNNIFIYLFIGCWISCTTKRNSYSCIVI
jgi:hypothetical protein